MRIPFRFLILALSFVVVATSGRSQTETKEAANPGESADMQNAPSSQTSVQPHQEEEVFNLSGYEPLYFIFGKPSKVKASFKYRLIKKIDFYFGYNQYVFWEIGQDSTPFQDVTYSPEFFYRWKVSPDHFVRSLDIIPYWHMSNGKKSETSRSLDRAAVQANFIQPIKNDVFRMSIRLSTPSYNLDNTNLDIRQYVGPWEVRASYSEIPIWFIKRCEVSVRYYTGGSFGQRFRRGGREIGISFPLSALQLNQAVYIQYFEGNAENLIHYNGYSRHLRMGLRL